MFKLHELQSNENVRYTQTFGWFVWTYSIFECLTTAVCRMDEHTGIFLTSKFERLEYPFSCFNAFDQYTVFEWWTLTSIRDVIKLRSNGIYKWKINDWERKKKKIIHRFAWKSFELSYSSSSSNSSIRSNRIKRFNGWYLLI